MDRVKKQLPTLTMMSKVNPSVRKALIQNGNEELICVLAEIIHNLLKGHVPINTLQKKKLAKYKGKFRRLCKECIKDKHININKTRNRLVSQTGGALPILLPIIASIIAKSALGGAVAATAGVVTKKILDR